MPEGAPGGGDDEYRSVVFDESFVRAARIQEFSARERLDGAARPVRMRHVLPHGLTRHAGTLILLIVLAFGFALYMGVRHPYKEGATGAGEPLRATVIPLAPVGTVAAVSAAAPFGGSDAARWRSGPAGIVYPPDVARVGGYAQSEVLEALETVKDYLTASALDVKAVTQGDVSAVRALLAPDQLDQFQDSLATPAPDGQHEATAWLVRFDPAARITLVGGNARVRGTFTSSQTPDKDLEILSDHTFVYALRGPGGTAVSLFTVRRQMRFRFDHQDIERQHLRIVQADVAAGPLSCTAEVQSYFRPILAGGRAPGGVIGADPYRRDRPVGAVCTALDIPAPTAALSPQASGTATAAAAATRPGAPAAAATATATAGAAPAGRAATPGPALPSPDYPLLPPDRTLTPARPTR